MNRYQKAIATMAALDILLLLLLPPFLDSPLQRGASRSFAGFYFLFMAPAGHGIDEPLLSIEILFVVVNALAAWLALTPKNGVSDHLADSALARGLLLFVVADLALILLFPPFEPYSSLIRTVREGGFDGFYFAFGDKRHRHLFLPFLYLEVIFVAINTLVAWLVFGLLRGTLSAADEQLVEAAHHIAPEKVDALLQVLEREASAKPEPQLRLGRHDERRHRQDPNYRGPERRSGRDRRHDGL
jgi:hypothetical protein